MKTAWLIAIVLGAMVMDTTTVSAQRYGRGGGPPSFDKLLEAFDDNDDGELSKDEVPPPVWSRLKQADANDDGVVTRKEFEAEREKRSK